MSRPSPSLFFLAVLFSPGLWAQQRPPVIQPPIPPVAGSGIPTPPWLGRGRSITGHIAGIDPDRMLLRSFEYGNVLFFVDEKTVVRVDKYRLSLSDLREGDPVAVRLKEIKGKGPYATEILAHPDVRRRKEHGDAQEPVESPGEPVQNTPSPARHEELAEPALPAGQKGVTGAVTEIRDDQATVTARDGKSRKVLITSVTRIVRAGSHQTLAEVRVGDRVAVMGDTLDTGVLVAREILVNRSGTGSAGSHADTGGAGGDFAGTIVELGTGDAGESIRVRTADGRERMVMVTGVTTIKRWGADVPFNTLRKGDQVTISGDVLEGGVVVAREVNVTKPSRG